MFFQFHVLPPVRQEVCVPPAGQVRHQLGEHVLQQSQDGGVKGEAKVPKESRH